VRYREVHRGDDRQILGLQLLVLRGAPMNRALILIAGVVALPLAAQHASAFSTRQVDTAVSSDRVANPDVLPNKTSGQSEGTTFGVPGGHLMLQFTGPPSSNTPSSPFLTSPGTAFVPSEHWGGR
jgi:hypothetical protein